VTHAVDDDAMLLWLSDRSAAATAAATAFAFAFAFAKKYLLAQSGTGTGINAAPKAYTRSGLTKVYASKAAADHFHVKAGDARVPDLLGVAQYGVVYTDGTKKIAEHGGGHSDDLDVPLVISGVSAPDGVHDSASVQTKQIAPTILSLLGLNPRSLQAVRVEHTTVLPVR
jgi:arylsulfatase A-like enzyme